MKILITGKNSFAGKEFVKRMQQKNRKIIIEAISVRDDKWKSLDFSVYDAIYHVAAIVHMKEKSSKEKEYYRVNSELTYEIASKAKKDGVKVFVFLSSIAVYGLLGEINKNIVISKKTVENPVTLNGKSKLKAEELLKTIESESFKVALLRIPLIYGENCPGNYSSLSKLAQITPVFPKVKNKRSMIFVDHLSDIVEHLIINKLSGLYLINNPENSSTLDIVEGISKCYKKNIYYSNAMGFIVKLIGNKFNITRKMFGTVYYKIEDTRIKGFEYENISFEKSIKLSEINN